MKYCFANRAWQGDFVEGPLRGESFSSSVDNMTAEKWAIVQAKWATVQAAVAVEFERATLPQLKEGTRLFLMHHCQTIEAQQLPQLRSHCESL